MDTYSARGNTIFCTFVTVMGTMAGLNYGTSYLPSFKPVTTGSINVAKVHDLTLNTYLNMDQSILSFNLNHDLTKEFHWNMNQLFVYLVAEYNSTSNVRNQVTVWDRIVSNADEAALAAKQLMIEYPMRDQYRELRGRDIKLIVRYRTMPIVGAMYDKVLTSTDFKSPDDYFRDASRKKR